MNQYDFKLGFYGEDVLQLNDRWLRIINGEIWYAFNRTIYSTWSGDAPSQRFNVYLNWMYQYKVSENWQIRFGGGPAYTGWDEMFWFNLGFEFRWKEFIMFGPGLAIPLGVNGKYYPGMTVADLLTWRAMVRVEFGRPLYWHFQEQKAAEVRKLRKETSRYKRAGD